MRKAPRAILWIAPEPPQNPGTGGPLRMYWILRGVREALPGTRHIGVAGLGTAFRQGVERAEPLFDELHWVGAVPREDSVEARAGRLFQQLSPHTFSVAASWWLPFLEPLANKCIEVLAQHPDIDVVHLEHLNLAPLAVWLRRYTSAPIVVTAQNTFTLMAGAEGGPGSTVERAGRRLLGAAASAAHLTPFVWYTGGRGLLVKALERVAGQVDLARHAHPIASAMDAWYAAKADLVLCMSEQEAGLLAQMGNHTAVAPNGASAKDLEPVLEARRKRSGPAPEAPLFGFVGTAAYPPYQAACALLLRAFTDAPGLGRLRLVGFEMGKYVAPTPAFGACASATLVDSPPELRPHLVDLDAMVMPIFSGGGTRLKVVEAVFAGIPLIASRKAVEGLALEPGRDYALIEDASPDAVRRAVSHFLAQRAHYERRVLQLREAWLGRYDWLAIGQRVAGELSTLADRASRWSLRARL